MTNAKGRRRSDLFADVLPGPFSAQKVCSLFALVGQLLSIVVEVAVDVAVVAVVGIAIVSGYPLKEHPSSSQFAYVATIILIAWISVGSVSCPCGKVGYELA